MTYFGIVDHFAAVSGEGISLEEKVHGAIEKQVKTKRLKISGSSRTHLYNSTEKKAESRTRLTQQ